MSNPHETDNFFAGPSALDAEADPVWAPASLGALALFREFGALALFREFMEETGTYDVQVAIADLHIQRDTATFR